MIIDAKLLGGFKIFKYAWWSGISTQRAGSVRIVVFTFMTSFAYFYLLSTIKLNKNIKIKLLSILGIALILYQIIFIQLTRQTLVMMALTTMLFLINIKNIVTKTFTLSIFCVALLFIVVFFLNNEDLLKQTAYYKIMESTKSEAEKSQEGNIAIRIKGIKFFYPYFEQTFGLGMGLTSVTTKGSPEYLGFGRGYVFTDLGFIAVFFRFGILSIILSTVILIRIFKDLRFIYKKGDNNFKIMADSLTYLFISTIIFLPVLKGFFYDAECLYYGTFFYIIYKLKSETILNEGKNMPAPI